MDNMLRRLRRRGVTRFSLIVMVTNQAARGFYLKYGFSAGRRVKGYYENGEDGLRMVKRWE
jgi:ribosomal protein S18 acetylase RimI-like enzyme